MIVNVDLNYDDQQKIQIKRFSEDPLYGINSFSEMNKEVIQWIKANPNIKIISSSYSSWEDTSNKYINTEEYRRSINISYIGVEDNSQCKHIVSKYKVENESTCTTEGVKKKYCRTCNKFICDETIPKKDHKYSWSFIKGTCTSNAMKIGICSICNHKENIEMPNTKIDHDYPDEWTIRNEATSCTDGIKYKLCKNCGNEITEIIRSNGSHKWIYNNDGKHKCEVCGLEENCYPNDPDTECEKCHHKFLFNLEILTDNIDDMEAEKPVEFKLQSNSINKSEESWSINNGSLPSGLSLSINGILSGMLDILSAGKYTIEVSCKYKDQIVYKTFSFIVAPKVCTITFDGNGGTIDGLNKKIIKIAAGNSIGELPEAELSGKVFGGWFTAPVDGLKIDENYSVASDVTFYARYGDEDSSIDFGDSVSQFNIQLRNDRTNYQNQPYTLYYRNANGASGTPSLVLQTGFSSDDRSNNITDTNKKVILFLKVSNAGESGDFDIGFDCDSYLVGDDDDRVKITRLENGVQLGIKNQLSVTVPYENTAWIGKYNERTSHRYDNSTIGASVSSMDTGYCLTMNNIHINKNSYVILEVTFQIP